MNVFNLGFPDLPHSVENLKLQSTSKEYLIGSWKDKGVYKGCSSGGCEHTDECIYLGFPNPLRGKS